MLGSRILTAHLLIAALALSIGCKSSSSSEPEAYAPTTDTSDLCAMPLAPNEPLCSTAFGDTAWPSSHRGSYAQGSSPLAGPTDAADTASAHVDLPGAGVPVIASFSAPYEDGGRAVWSTVTGLDGAIVKLDHESFEIIDWYVPAEREEDPPNFVTWSERGVHRDRLGQSLHRRPNQVRLVLHRQRRRRSKLADRAREANLHAGRCLL